MFGGESGDGTGVQVRVLTFSSFLSSPHLVSSPLPSFLVRVSEYSLCHPECTNRPCRVRNQPCEYPAESHRGRRMDKHGKRKEPKNPTTSAPAPGAGAGASAAAGGTIVALTTTAAAPGAGKGQPKAIKEEPKDD